MKKILLIAAMAVFAFQVNAQTHFSLHAGGALPMGDFGAYSKVEKMAIVDQKGKEGAASMGLNLGLKAKFDIASVDGLGVILTGDVFFNGSNSDFSDDMAKYLADNLVGQKDDWETTSPKHLNIPIMIGANYTYKMSDNLGIFAEAAIGANFRKITNLTETYTDPTGDEVVLKSTFDMATTMAFQIGAGMIINEKFSVGLHYYSLGNSKVKGKATEEYPSSWGFDDVSENFKLGKLTTGMLAIRVGLHF